MIISQNRGHVYAVLQAALRRPGCPICRVRSESLARFFSWFGIETYWAPDMVEQLTRAGGFCAMHTRTLTQGINPYAGTVTAQYVLAGVRADLQQVQATPQLARRRRRRRVSTSQAVCPACVLAAEEDVILSREWSSALDVPEFREQIPASDGLCLPHLRLVLDCTSPPTAVNFLHEQIEQIEQLEAELADYLRKTDYRFANEPKGAEQTAWQRAWERLAGWPLDRLTNRHDTQ